MATPLLICLLTNYYLVSRNREITVAFMAGYERILKLFHLAAHGLANKAIVLGFFYIFSLTFALF